MNKVIFRFIIVKEFDYFEVAFDARLSFIENFELLKDIKNIDTSNLHIYDFDNKLFLSLDKPIFSLNLNYYNKLLIF